MDVLRYTAFSSDPGGGNRAGIVLDATGVPDDRMLAAAAEVGYSETAFLIPAGTDRVFDVRYFSPLAEVPFCGHATIAAAAAYAERFGGGELMLRTAAGPVAVQTTTGTAGASATFTSVPPRIDPLTGDDLARILAALHWETGDLDPALPPAVAFAGAHHPIVTAATRDRLARLDYDFDALGELMASRGWTTIDLVWREAATSFHARNPFPPGGVVEDPATGAAAAAFGGYLRELRLLDAPVDLTVEQGWDMGRPSRIDVFVPAGTGGVRVSGAAVELPPPDW